MKIKTKLIVIFSILTAAIITICCIFAISFTREKILQNIYETGYYDYIQFYNNFSSINSNADKTSAIALTEKALLKYNLYNTYGSSEYILQTSDEFISNNVGVEPLAFLQEYGKEPKQYPETKYGYLKSGSSYFFIISKSIHINQTDYYLSLARNITKTFDEINGFVYNCIFVCCGLFIISALIIFIAVKQMLSPLHHLQKGVRKISEGVYTKITEIKGNNEISDLACDYNKMAAVINDTINELKNTSENRKLLLSAVSHEIKTPVAAISACSHSLTHLKLSEEQKKEIVMFIEQESLRLERLSSKLIQVIVAENTQKLETAPISAQELTKRIKEILLPVSKKNKISLSFQIHKAPVYLIDLDLFTCVITNLFDNSKKANASKIIIGFDKNKICFGDNGDGIPKDKIPFITEPFYKLDSSRNTVGFGLGLFLTNKIVKLHNAKLVIESETTVGTKIIIQF